MWDFPTKADILDVTNKLAAVLTKQPVAGFLVGAPLTQKLKVAGAENIDAAVWVKDDEILVSIVNLDYKNTISNVTVSLPEGIEAGGNLTNLWGDGSWSLRHDKLYTSSVKGLEVSLLLLKRM
jgi:hypothetical protein